jgi:hypothetical protein
MVIDCVTAKSRADAFVSYFVCKIDNIRKDIQVKLINTVGDITVPSVPNTVPFTVFQPVTPLEVTTLIKSKS